MNLIPITNLVTQQGSGFVIFTVEAFTLRTRGFGGSINQIKISLVSSSSQVNNSTRKAAFMALSKF